MGIHEEKVAQRLGLEHINYSSNHFQQFISANNIPLDGMCAHLMFLISRHWVQTLLSVRLPGTLL